MFDVVEYHVDGIKVCLSPKKFVFILEANSLIMHCAPLLLKVGLPFSRITVSILLTIFVHVFFGRSFYFNLFYFLC